jgi:hypothetical protein
MSTKTTFKRIALVAVAALGFGVLSVVPSQATELAVTVTPSATSSAIKTGETATITLAVSGILTAATDSITVNGARTAGASGTVNFIVGTDSATGTNIRQAAGYNSAITIDSATASSSNNVAVRVGISANFVNPTTAGTYKVTIYTATNNDGVDITPIVWTITVTADSKLADTNSTAYMASGEWTAERTSDAVVTGSKVTTATVAGTIKIVQNNSTSSATEAMTAYVTGPGFVSGGSATSTGNSRSTTRVISLAAPTVGAATYVKVWSDGTSGVSNIKVVGALSGLVLADKTVTFVDNKPASVTVTTNKKYIAAGLTTTKVFAIVVKDAAGNAITTGVDVAGTPTETTTAIKAIASAALSACAYDSTAKVWYCSATGASSSKFGPVGYTVTVTGTDADETEVTGTASVTYSDIVATKVTITAPATASIGDKVTYTLTATEKNGYPVADSTYEGGSANGSVGGIFWNTTTAPDYTSSSVTPFNAGETITTVSGVATKDIYMPVAAGVVTNTWTLAGSSTTAAGAIDKTIAGTTIVTATAVSNPGVDAATDAANEATDAANAATDAALAAADAADAATAAAQDASDAVAALSASVSKLISSLRAQITSLTNLVIKIQKKVKA